MTHPDTTTDSAPECPFPDLCLDCVGKGDTPIEAIARGLIVSFG